MQLAVSLGMPGARVRKKSEAVHICEWYIPWIMMNNAMHQDPISNLKSGSHYPNRFNLVSKDSGLQDFCTSLRVCPQGVEKKQEKCATTDARNRLELVHRIHGLPLLAMRNLFEIRVRDRMIRMPGVTTSFEKLTPASQTAGLLNGWWMLMALPFKDRDHDNS